MDAPFITGWGRHATPAELISQNNPTQQVHRLNLLSIALEQIAGINPHLTIGTSARLTLKFHPTAGIWGCSTPSTNHGLEPASARLTPLQPISPNAGADTQYLKNRRYSTMSSSIATLENGTIWMRRSGAGEGDGGVRCMGAYEDVCDCNELEFD